MGILRLSATGMVPPILTTVRQVGFGVGVISGERLKRNKLSAGCLAPNDGPLAIRACPGFLHFTREGFTRNLDENACRTRKAAHSGPTGNKGCILSAGG
jgi:hypothetical protein